MYLNRVHDVKLTGFEITGANAFLGAGVQADCSSNVIITYNVVRNNRDIGVHLASSTNVLVRQNDVSYNSIGIQVKYAGGGDQIETTRCTTRTRWWSTTPRPATTTAPSASTS